MPSSASFQKEEKIIAFLKAFGEKHKLETKVDEAGNVLIKKPATPGMENRKTVVLQSHVDMVCEKTTMSNMTSSPTLLKQK